MTPESVDISPEYMSFMTRYAGVTIYKRLLTRGHFTQEENAMLSLIALTLCNRPLAREEFVERLSERGDLVVEQWLEFYGSVVGHNRRGSSQIPVSVSAFLDRWKR